MLKAEKIPEGRRTRREIFIGFKNLEGLGFKIAILSQGARKRALMLKISRGDRESGRRHRRLDLRGQQADRLALLREERVKDTCGHEQGSSDVLRFLRGITKSVVSFLGSERAVEPEAPSPFTASLLSVHPDLKPLGGERVAAVLWMHPQKRGKASALAYPCWMLCVGFHPTPLARFRSLPTIQPRKEVPTWKRKKTQ